MKTQMLMLALNESLYAIVEERARLAGTNIHLTAIDLIQAGLMTRGELEISYRRSVPHPTRDNGDSCTWCGLHRLSDVHSPALAWTKTEESEGRRYNRGERA